MVSFFTHNLLWSQGINLLFVITILIICSYFWRPLLFVAAGLFLFSLYFFRNPDRECPEASTNKDVLVCPADGKIVSIEQLPEQDEFGYKIAIFLSPFDVHVTRCPLTSKVAATAYRKGIFKMAFLPKSSELNEANDILLQTTSGTLIKVRQIAGTIARVIVCWVREGDELTHGQTMGMIKFGSRVELFLPRAVAITVQNGQRVYGGQTVIGVLQ